MTYKTLNSQDSRKRVIRPQSAMLTLYGDYLLDRGEEIGIGSLIILFSNFGSIDSRVLINLGIHTGTSFSEESK